MPQHFLSELEIASLRIDETGGGMSERMETGTAFLSWNAGTIQNGIEHILPHDVGMKRCSVRLAKNRIGRTNVAGVLKVFFQNAREHFTKTYRSHTGLGFCCHQLPLPAALLNPQRTPFKINMPPLQPEQ